MENSGGGRRTGRPENLVPWRPGQSGNPGGRPKRKPISDAYTAILEAVNSDGVTGAQMLAIAMFQQALKGNVQAAKEITDRVEGALRQSVDVVFGSMTDEELEEWIAEHLADASDGGAGSETTGDEPSSDPATPSADESSAG